MTFKMLLGTWGWLVIAFSVWMISLERKLSESWELGYSALISFRGVLNAYRNESLGPTKGRGERNTCWKG